MLGGFVGRRRIESMEDRQAVKGKAQRVFRIENQKLWAF